MTKLRSPAGRAAAMRTEKDLIAYHVYRWWRYGGMALFKPDGTPTNKGRADAVNDLCAKIYERRRVERELKRRLK